MLTWVTTCLSMTCPDLDGQERSCTLIIRQFSEAGERRRESKMTSFISNVVPRQLSETYAFCCPLTTLTAALNSSR